MKLPKFIRKIIQRKRINDIGWSCFGKVWLRNPRTDFYIKRSNWCYNIVNHGIAFKGTCK